MSEAQKPLPILRVVVMPNGKVGVVRRVPTFPGDGAVELYDASWNSVFMPDREGKMVEILHLNNLAEAITKTNVKANVKVNPSRLDLLAVATALIREGVISIDYKVQCLAYRPPPPGFKDPKVSAPKPC